MNIIIIILLVFFISMIHICLYNKIEKEFVQLIFGNQLWTRRPTKICNNDINILLECEGMPSGHAETVTLICILLTLFKISPIYLSISIIIIIGLQRILWRRHTIYQVLVGILLGCLYSLLYFSVWKIHPLLTILLCFSLVFGLSIINILIITYYQHQKMPDWQETTLLIKIIIYISLIHRSNNINQIL